jgi:probable F420-dependent oxidoreductase
MTAVAGEVADGLIAHPFSTERYLREVTIPALERGAKRAGRDQAPFEILAPNFVVTGDNDEQIERSAKTVRERIAFYASTPAYRSVLEMHGWGDLQGELNRMSKTGQWGEMGNLITDEMLETFAVCTRPDEVGKALAKRYGDVCHRVTLSGTAVSQAHRERTLASLAAVTPGS